MKTQTPINALSLLLLAALTLTGCNLGSKKTTHNEVQFDSISVQKTYNLLDNPDNPNCNLQIAFTFPVKYSNDEVLQKIQKQVISSSLGEVYENSTPAQAIEQYSADYLTAYKELEDDFKADLEKRDERPVGAWYSYYEMLSNKIVFNESDLLSYTVYMESYTGGAHGAHAHTNHVLNLKTGELVTEEDIFVPNFQGEISRLLVDKIAQNNKVENPKELENIGYFSIDEIFPNGNILVDATGVTYTFNEYEIAAYVVGATHIHLPFGEIKHLLKPDSPIAQLLSN